MCSVVIDVTLSVYCYFSVSLKFADYYCMFFKEIISVLFHINVHVN